MKIRIFATLAIAALLAAPAVAPAQGPEIGKPAPAFTAVDSNGKKVSLGDFTGKFVVLEWVCHVCPFVKKFYDSNKMQELQKELTGKGIVWLSICSSAQGKGGYMTPEQANASIRDKGACPTALLLDTDGAVGRAYGAKTTPHMFVICPKGNLLYAGAIDSVASTNPGDIPGATNYVKAAIEETMAGKGVTTPTTKPYGCGVKY